MKAVRRITAAIAVLAGAFAAAVTFLIPEKFEVPPREDRAIAGVTLLNPGEAPVLDQTIVIRNGRIAEIRDRTAKDGAPICEGCFAVPGLIDAHTHIPPRLVPGNQRLFALLYLSYGVTSIRDVGQSSPSVGDFARKLNRGEFVGPRMYRCGPVLDGEPPSWPAAKVVLTKKQGEDAVRKLAASHVDCIKVYNEISLDAFEGIKSAAAQYGLPVIGHVPNPIGLKHVRDFEAQHVTGIPYVSLLRPPLAVDYRSIDLLKLSDAAIDEAIEIAAARNVSFTPTVANHSLRLIASDPVRFPPTEGARHLPGFWADAWNIISAHPKTPEAIDIQVRATRVYDDIVRKIHARGIDLLAGTDTLMAWVIPGESLHLELRELASVMDDPVEALKSATVVNGRHIDEGAIGVLAPGAYADILLLPSDPRDNLETLRDWNILFVGGRLYHREAVDAWLARYDRHFHSIYYESVMNGIAHLLASRFADRQASAPDTVAAEGNGLK